MLPYTGETPTYTIALTFLFSKFSPCSHVCFSFYIVELNYRLDIPPVVKPVLDRFSFFFIVIESEWRNLKLYYLSMLKLESSYQYNFPKNQDSGLGPSSIESSNSGEDVRGATEDAPPCNADIDTHISHVTNLPGEDYEEVWGVLSLHPIVTLKSTIEVVLPGNIVVSL